MMAAGTRRPLLASITGVNGEMGAAVGAVILNTTHTAAGTYAVDSWSFGGTANYNNIVGMPITDTTERLPLRSPSLLTALSLTATRTGQPLPRSQA